MSLHAHRESLDDACSQLRVRKPVIVKFEVLRCPQNPNAFVQGQYDGLDLYQGIHFIRINPRQTTLGATAALWHELTHAHQVERHGSFIGWQWEYDRQIRQLGIPYGAPGYFEAYRECPFEAEAWAATAAARRGELWQLCCAAETCNLSG